MIDVVKVVQQKKKQANNAAESEKSPSSSDHYQSEYHPGTVPGTPTKKNAKDSLLPVISMSKVTVVKKRRKKEQQVMKTSSSPNLFEEISIKATSAA